MSDGGDLPDDETLHERALRHLDEAWTAEIENFDNGRDDQRFANGEQWLTAAKDDRLASNRPVITINRIRAFTRQVTGDARRDMPAVKVAPAKDGASQEIADIYNGLIRNIEVESNGKAAYVQALANACDTGLGVFKIVKEYSDNDGFDQDIRIKRIVDPFAVIFDPAAKEPDKSDARYCAEFIDIPKEEFKRQYPDAPTDGVPSGPNSIQGLSWYSMQSVRVAYYWEKVPVKKQLLLLADGRTIDADEALKETEAGGQLEVVNKRAVDSHVVKWAIISGHEVLSGPDKWDGKYLPYCPVIGEESWVDGRCIRKGMVRDAKDAQRVYNYMRTAAVEAAALQPKSPWVVTVDMIKGLDRYWKTAGSKNHPYLPYNPDKTNLSAKPERAQPALAQAGLDSQSAIASDELKAVTGIYDASLGAKSNETSGRAILARQKEGDTGTYHYIDNLATAIRHCGRILVDLIPKTYDTQRVVRVLKEDGSHEMAEINAEGQGEPDPLTGFIGKANDLALGEYDVTVITGPSFATRRMEASETLTELIRSAPQLMGIAGDIIIKNLDFPGAEEIAKRMDEMRNKGPDPAAVAEGEKTVAEADKAKAEAEGQQLNNLSVAIGMLQTLQGIPQIIAGMEQQLAALTGAQQAPQGPQPGPAPQPAPSPPIEEYNARYIQPAALALANQIDYDLCGGPPGAPDEPEMVDISEGASA